MKKKEQNRKKDGPAENTAKHTVSLTKTGKNTVSGKKGRPSSQNKPDAETGQSLFKEDIKSLNILDNIGIGYFELDLKGTMTYFNDSICKKLGYTREELMGMNFRAFIRSEDIDLIKGIYHEIYLSGKAKTMIQTRIINKHGAHLTIEQSIALMKDEKGTITGFHAVARDITEWLKTELDIERSEEKYRTILETMEEGFFESDYKGDFTFANDAGCRLLGYTRDELIGMSYRKIYSPEMSEYTFKLYSEIFRTGKPMFLMDYKIIRKDGSVRIHQANAAVRRDSNNKPIGFRVLARDVTEKKQREEKFRTIIETMVEGFFECDLKGVFTFINDAGCRILGYERNELIGSSYKKIHKPDVADRLKVIFNRVYRTGKAEFMILHDIVRKDGAARLHQSNVALLKDPSGRPEGFSVFVDDVTEQKKAEEALKRSEEKYRMMAENVSDIIWTMDLDAKITYVSNSVFRIAGYRPEELLQVSAYDILSEDMAQRLAEVVSAILGNKKNSEADHDPARTTELGLRRKDGTDAWFDVSITVARDEQGTIQEILGVARDISERKEAEREKARLESQLVQAQKMESVGRLAGGIAHDFNNMLSVILGYTELIKLDLSPEDALMKDMLEIEKAALRSRDITSQLLAFSRKQIIAPVIIDLNELINGIHTTLARLIGEDIELQFLPSEDIWRIRVDPSQMQQILINLAANARDAMPGGGKLIIETGKTYLDENYCRQHLDFIPGEYVILGVNDDGIGMDKETLDNAFEPFFTTKEVNKGTGLGLATVYGIIRQNNGFINVYSEPGRGTTFRIYIPRAPEEALIAEPQDDETVLTGSETILLVEDDDMVRGMTRDMLAALKYTVMATGDAFEALSIAGDNNIHIDLLITDVVMPDMGGKELRDKISAMRPGVKVLFMSGYASNVIVHQGVLEAGVHFIQKPFNMNDLAMSVHRVLRTG